MLILLLSSTLNPPAHSPGSPVHADSGGLPTPPNYPFYPYLANTSEYPTPDLLPNVTGGVSLPQLGTLSIGGVPSLALSYVDSDPMGNQLVEFRVGSYSPWMAQAIATHSGCTDACTQHIPIRWGAPVPIATYGNSPIQGDSMAITGDTIGVAVSSNNTTEVYVSFNGGMNGTWGSLTGSQPVWGWDPHLAFRGPQLVATRYENCSAIVTTLVPGGAVVNSFDWGGIASNVTGLCGPRVAWNGRGGGEPLGSISPPSVTSLLPDEAQPGATITLTGNNLGSVQQVLFGGAAAAFRIINSTAISATAPQGSGSPTVSVWNAGGWSVTNCSNQFVYGARTPVSNLPQVDWLSPWVASSGSQVTIGGVDLGSATAVYFGTASASFTVKSSTKIVATAPSEIGGVNVTVRSSAGWSLPTCDERFEYTTPAEPMVTSISPLTGASGTTVTIDGSLFLSNASVYFGSIRSSSFHYVTGSQLTATAPTNYGLVPVTVSQGVYNSTASCPEQFAYVASSNPLLSSLNASATSSGSELDVFGSGFSTSTIVTFSGVPATRVYSVSTSELKVQVPEGYGPVRVLVSGPSGITPLNCADWITIAQPSLAPGLGGLVRSSINLGAVVRLAPVALPLAGDWGVATVTGGSSPAVAFDALTLSAAGVLSDSISSSLVPVGLSSGQPGFYQIGATSTSMNVPGAGEVAIAVNASELVIVFTTASHGRTDVESLTSSDSGSIWSGPYLWSSVSGSVLDPSIVTSPAGFLFATWITDLGGAWEVDQAILSSTGTVVQSPEAIPQSGGTAFPSTEPPTLVVDQFERPVYAWTYGTLPSSSSIFYTGAYLNPLNELSNLWAGFNSTIPADYLDFGINLIGLAQFQQQIDHELGYLHANITANQLCSEQRLSIGPLYTNITKLDPVPLISTPTTECSTPQGIDNSILANLSGPTQPNFYLSVSATTLLESVGAGVFAAPAWGNLAGPGLNQARGPFVPGKPVRASDLLGDAVAIEPLAATPNVVWLNTTGEFPGESAVFYNQHGSTVCGRNTTIEYPITFDVSVDVNNGRYSNPYINNDTLPSVFLTNLGPAQNGTWGAFVNVTFGAIATAVGNHCASSYGYKNGTWKIPVPGGWPNVVSFHLTSGYTTGLDPFPATLELNSTYYGSNAAMKDTLHWEDTVAADAGMWFNSTSCPTCSTSWKNPAFANFDQSTQFVATGYSYTVTLWEETTRGLTNSTGPVFDANLASVPAPNETVSFSCSFFQEFQQNVISGFQVSNVTGTSATISWYDSSSGIGWIEYNATDGGWENQSAVVVSVSHNNTYKYLAQLHGLDPWSTYNVVGHVDIPEACTGSSGPLGISVQYPAASTRDQFETNATFELTEQDTYYDSISKAGGGATIFWQVPSDFTNRSTFLNGSLIYYPVNNRSAAIAVPLSAPLSPALTVPRGWSGSTPRNTTYQSNLTTLIVNTTYAVNVTLNYSSVGNPHFVAQAMGFHFVYQRDTSGDGLTDWEKEYGWNVTYKNYNSTYCGWVNEWDWSCDLPSTAWQTVHVSANPNLYATNGLVGDLVEKEYGLNPNTVDSANSHMLDTWNLTFNLKPGGGIAPKWSDFAYFYESSNYNPFSSSVEYSPGYFETGHPVSGGANISNISAVASHGNTSGDGSGWAAEALWSYSALQAFSNLSGVINAGKLRAVVGSWDGVPTLTVWGKLSWGDDPLISSSLGTGFSAGDGERLNPLGTVDLQINVSNLYVTGLSANQGYAASFAIIASKNGYGYPELLNYSAPVGGSGDPSRLTNYDVAIPVPQNSQYQTIRIQILANLSGNDILTPIPFNGSSYYATISYDMFAGKIVSESYNNNSYGGQPNGSLSLTVSTVLAGGKSTTYLWTPTNNTTVSNLPVGLKRYVGEPSFDLLVLNSSGSLSSDAIESPFGLQPGWMNLSQGLTNLLIPRTQFLDSIFGEAVLLGHAPAYRSNQTPPMLTGSEETNLLGSFGNASLAEDLAAYWQNLAIYSGPGSIAGTTEQGTSNSSSLAIRIAAVSAPGSNNTGGMTMYPQLYNSTDATAAIQSIITLNVTSKGELDLLIAALIDNVTGGVNGTLQGVTSQISFLGLDSQVVGALANRTTSSDGLYGVPESHSPPPQGPTGLNWNSVVAIVTNPAGALVSLVEYTWTLTVAVDVYLGDLVHEALAIDGQLLARELQVLQEVAKILVEALELLLSYILVLVKADMNIALLPITLLVSAYGQSLNSNVYSALSTLSNGNISRAASLGIWEAMSGALFVIAMGIAIAVELALTLLAIISMGSSELVVILITILIGTTASLVFPQLNSYVTGKTVWLTEDFINLTKGQLPQQNFWTVAACNYGYMDDTITTPYAAIELREALSTSTISQGKLTNTAVALALSVAACAADAEEAVDHSLFLSVMALAFAGGSVVTDVLGLIGHARFKWSEATGADYVVLGMDAVATYAAWETL